MPTDASNTTSADHDPARDILSERVVPFPRELVFRAWTEAEHLARWWGPTGFRNTFAVFDPTPGGQWRFTMHGPDGKDHPNHSCYVVVARPARIVIDHLSAPRFRLSATFTERDGGTAIAWRMRFEESAVRDALRALIAPANEQNLDRLEAELRSMS